ncbi:hypothetical protein GDO78_018890 [Eleutherodactylus coqui]|uniref:Uncharacterized protein n=1 Tax=Eleutherodactylus coqui TaxID=57060 RepID=A0A8J6BDA5_ELECQ|nr:hypothetical protein GDO78_018890 [Eleutherodactylus coqui]
MTPKCLGACHQVLLDACGAPWKTTLMKTPRPTCSVSNVWTLTTPTTRPTRCSTESGLKATPIFRSDPNTLQIRGSQSNC